MKLKGKALYLACLLVLSPGRLLAQEPPPEIVDLKALVFILQTKLAAVEKELGEEKARRAALEEAELLRARESLDPALKRRLGLPVPEAQKPDVTAPQTPPKS